MPEFCVFCKKPVDPTDKELESIQLINNAIGSLQWKKIRHVSIWNEVHALAKLAGLMAMDVEEMYFVREEAELRIIDGLNKVFSYLKSKKIRLEAVKKEIWELYQMFQHSEIERKSFSDLKINCG